MKRYKRTFTTDERELVFDLWKRNTDTKSQTTIGAVN